MAKRKRESSSTETPQPQPLPGQPGRGWVPIQDVLRPIAPQHGQDSDEWLMFDVEDATVYGKDGVTVSNALYVEHPGRGPFILRGTLVLDSASRKSVLPEYRELKSVPVEIANCKKYSIGQAEDETARPIIWISGPSGWFEIEPSAEYRPIYDHMCRAAFLYFSIEIVQDDLLHKGRPAVSIDELMLEHSVRAGNSLDREQQLYECRLFSTFLAHHMRYVQEAWLWDRTDIFKLLIKMEREALAAGDADGLPPAAPTSLQRREPSAAAPSALLRSRLENQRRLPTRSREGVMARDADALADDAAAETADRDTPEGMLEDTPPPSPPPLPSRRTPPRASIIRLSPEAEAEERPPPPVAGFHQGQQGEMWRQPSPDDSKDSAVDSYSRGLESMVRALDAVWEEKGEKKLSEAFVRYSVYLLHRISNYRSASNMIAYYARDLADRLDDPRWNTTDFYSWILQQATKPWVAQETDPGQPPFIFERRKHVTTSSGRKSATVKMAGGGGDGNGSSSGSMPGRRAGKAPPTYGQERMGTIGGLRLLSQERQLTSPFDDSDASSSRSRSRSQRKTNRSSHLFHRDGESETEPEDDGDDDGDVDDNNYKKDAEPMGRLAEYNQRHRADVASPDRGMPLSHPVNMAPSIRPFIRAQIGASTKPRGPGGTWVCDAPECGKVIRAVPNQAEQIQTHIASHQTGSSAAVAAAAAELDQEIGPGDGTISGQFEVYQLAISEGNKGGMPIKYAFIPPITVYEQTPAQAPPPPSPSGGNTVTAQWTWTRVSGRKPMKRSLTFGSSLEKFKF